MVIRSYVLLLSVSSCPVLLLLPLAVFPLLNCARAFSILIKASVTSVSLSHVSSSIFSTLQIKSASIYSHAFAVALPAGDPPANLFLCTSLKPPASMIRISAPRMTASVTIAPMTPATAFEIPPPLECELEVVPEEELAGPLDPDPESALGAQTPVLFPQRLHHCPWLPTANWFIPVTKSFHGRTVSLWPKRGYAVGSEILLVVPLWNKKRTLISSAEGKEVEDTVAFVTSSQVSELA